jgi:hypothetical protein
MAKLEPIIEQPRSRGQLPGASADIRLFFTKHRGWLSSIPPYQSCNDYPNSKACFGSFYSQDRPCVLREPTRTIVWDFWCPHVPCSPTFLTGTQSSRDTLPNAFSTSVIEVHSDSPLKTIVGITRKSKRQSQRSAPLESSRSSIHVIIQLG